ncbi:hypothetical protein BS47DRAFT_1291086 [Hydnum rufescens UP504]|uniref:NACHT domain-containing protein n=1 Tax=Hydnum rufescens UP504 TaxID=1448309 RepID=A0A9P6B481_9AGAM|nr:hypothetical protein BS47DRAFT_1291086 [Hydnum rufescens UP504]
MNRSNSSTHILVRALPTHRKRGKHVSASFEASSARTCLYGTRTEILQELREWASGDRFPHEHFCWVHGPPGTGKSTLAKTIAEELDSAGRLAASFFFSRDRESRRNPQVVFPTLARQLSSFNEDFARALNDCRAKHPSVDDAIMETQLLQLIIEPLRHMIPGPMPWVIILDALDECSGQSAASSATEILNLLGLHAKDIPSHIRILVTSRPEHAMDSAFHVGSLHPITRIIDLHHMDASIAADDIRRYVHHELSGEWAVREGWKLGAEDLQLLSTRADGLFIYAATAIKLIKGAAESGKTPVDTLRILLHPEDPNIGSQLPPLNALYLQILDRAFSRDDPSTFKLYRRVMGAIAHLKNPLGVRPLACLLGMDPNSIFYILRPLQSVLLVPKDGGSQVRFYHKSFRDFIVTPPERVSESGGTNLRDFFFPDQAVFDIRLAEDCFISMSLILHPNMCGSKDPLRLNNSILDLETRIQVHLPAHARYACLHWALHLNSQARHETALAKHRLEHWTRTQMLYWLEALSLTNDLERAIDCLRQAELWYQSCDSPSNVVIQILKDGQNFVRTFFDPIQQSAGHIYQSALSCTPDSSLLSNYRGLLNSSVKVLQGRSSGWNPFLWSATGRTGWARSVAFSPDGRRIVSGSHEKAVHVWSTDTGKLQTTLHGHDGWIGNALFSPDGERIVSGSFDSTIRIWSPPTGRLLNTIQTEATFIWSVTFSPDGTRIASGSGDNRVRLWSAHTGKLVCILEGHGAGVLTVAWSPDGRCLASGSLDNSIRIWSSSSRNMLHTLNGHSAGVLSVAFSPDGQRVASGSSDGTAILWIIEPGRSTYTMNILKSHNGWVWSVAFSPDGTHLVSGSGDKMIHVWSTATGQLLQTLSGHSAGVFSVAYSPDGTRIASASSDDTIRLWSAETTPVDPARDNHDGRIRVIAFSRDGSFIISGSDDKTARLWSTKDGRLIHTFVGHAAGVICLAFSLDAKRVATGSIDCTVKIWST